LVDKICGTMSSYRNGGCRCEKCRAANAEYSRKYASLNPEKIKEGKRKQYLNNPEKTKTRYQEWIKNNPDRYKELSRLKEHRRRALLNSVNSEFYTESDIIKRYGTKCHICNLEIDFNTPRSSKFKGWETGLQLDHVVPLSSGGSDTIDNIMPSHGICNIKKGDKIID